MTETTKAVVFRVSNEEYALPIQYVISIEKMESTTPIPHLPPYVKGIMTVRGELIPVLDFEKILYNRFTQDDLTIRLIVVHTEALSIGLLVNEAKEIIDIAPEAIKQLGLLAYHKTNYFMGIANLDSRLITIIDPNQLVLTLDGVKDIKEHMKYQHQE